MVVEDIEIKKLISWQRDVGESVWFLSVYVPNNGLQRDDLLKQVGLKIKNRLEESDELGEKDELIERVVDQFVEEAEGVDKLSKGIAGWVRLRFDELGEQSEETVVQRISVAGVSQSPEEEIEVGKALRLRQLAWLKMVEMEGLVLHLEREKAKLFKIKGDKMDLVEEKENPFVYEDDKEYLEQYSPTGSEKTMYGTGGRGFENRKEESNKRFVNRIDELLKREADSQHNFVIVLYSDSFADKVSRWQEDVEYKWSRHGVIAESKIFNKDNEILEEAQKLIKERQKNLVKNKWEEVQESEKWVIGWKNVVQAAREGKVEDLFITKNAERDGYVDDSWLYTHAAEGAEKTEDLASLLVIKVIRDGGKVWSVEVLGDKIEVGARLRY